MNYIDRVSINGNTSDPIIGVSGDRYYEGVDLTVKFADEIAASPYNGNPWAWIKARITAADYKGLHVNDYIPWTATNGKKVKSCIAGFDTYKGFSDANIDHHIDFISRDLWYEKHVMNSVNFNNGITKTDGTAVEHPWLASDLYHWLNALAGEVPGGTAVGGAPVAVDYTTTGVYAFLPDELKAVIVPKRVYLPKRYSESGNLTSDNAGAWMDIGNLWVPAELEVAGAVIWGDVKYGAMSFVQYPIFNCNANRIKGLGDGGSRYSWWTLSATTVYTTAFVCVYGSGIVLGSSASYTSAGAPVCFRIV